SENMTPEFLDPEDVLELHEASLERWGGSDGIRDQGALEAAIAQPQATFAGEYLHDDLFSMAAAYAFHISESQAFLDGNKRTALLAAVVFLDMNGFRLLEPEDVLYLAMLEIADRKMTKARLANLLRELADV
ncbi:MAG TPA: type II toxin-antitoxin system death-on-curing family toxin, partial [Polyangiaceae bacterium]|nr:type II toxin-antitoxin system death-on-curing family toxin [Polyangiaceae bacterium]